MKPKSKTERLPRWRDCATFGISGFTICIALFFAGKVDAAFFFATRVGIVLAVLMVVTAIRQRK